MIELSHVVKRYEGQEKAALNDVTLSLQKGEFSLLTGKSGAGKTTLLRLLFGAIRATSGQVIINGQDVASLKDSQIPLLRRKIGVVFQDFKLLKARSVFDNVALALEVQSRRKVLIKDKTDAILKDVGLAHKSDIPCAQLSGGEQQRVAIARALVGDPLLLLADEPTGNLDPELSKAIFTLLDRAHNRGTTVLVATHDPAITEARRSRIIKLCDGRVAR